MESIVQGCCFEPFSKALCHKWQEMGTRHTTLYTYEKFRCSECKLICIETWQQGRKEEKLVSVEYDAKDVIYNQINNKEIPR